MKISGKQETLIDILINALLIISYEQEKTE